MSILNRILVLVGIALVVFIAMPVVAAEMDHDHMNKGQMNDSQMDHSQMNHDKMDHQPMNDAPISKTPMHAGEHHSEKMPMEKSADQPMNHDMHQMNGNHDVSSMHGKPSGAKNSASLNALAEQPKSGKAREAGYDERYVMEDTSLHQTINRRCALASRGLIMLDKASWSQCNGQSAGSTKPTVSKPASDEQHNMHE